MNQSTMLLGAVFAAPLVYVMARIIFSAYFTAKAAYQQRLLNHLSRGED